MGDQIDEDTNFITCRHRDYVVILVFLSWAGLGVFAFGTSVACTWKSGTAHEKMAGIGIAMIMGPLYFFYKRQRNATYCQATSKHVS